MDRNAIDRFADNPFFVLGLPPSCARAEIEREGRRLLAMLELGLSAALVYQTPVGERRRTADKVRAAMADLRAPERRIVHEMWARMAPGTGGDSGAKGGGDATGDGKATGNGNGTSDGGNAAGGTNATDDGGATDDNGDAVAGDSAAGSLAGVSGGDGMGGAMIPVAPIVVALIALSSYASRRKGTPQKKAANRTRWHWVVWAFVAPGVILLIPLMMSGEVRVQVGAPLFLFGLILMFPWAITRHALVPLNLSRYAYEIAAISDIIWSLDHRGGGAIAAAWALLRNRNRDPRVAEWIEARIAARKQMTAADIVATGLVAAARGDLEQARALLGSVDHIEPSPTPRMAYALAAEWLAADAVARGDWKRVEQLGSGVPLMDVPTELLADDVAKRRPRSRATRFLGEAATRIEGESWPPSDGRLWWLWLVSLRPIALWPLLRRALATRIEMLRVNRPDPIDPGALSGDRLRDALAVHAAILRRPAQHLLGADLQRFGDAWDAALADPATRRLSIERSLALGVDGGPNGDRALDQMALAVQQDLANLARAADIPIAVTAQGRTAAGAAQQIRDELLAEIELSCDVLRRRVDEKRAVAGIEEWREWTRLRLLCERAARLGGDELRRLAFPKVHPDVCALAVWLWNVRGERLIANTLFRWLLVEATAVADSRAVELQRKNCGCGS